MRRDRGKFLDIPDYRIYIIGVQGERREEHRARGLCIFVDEQALFSSILCDKGSIRGKGKARS